MKKTSGQMTLVEVLALISVVGIVWVILLPVYAYSGPGPAWTTDLNSMKQVGLAIQMYAADNDDGFPWSKSPLDTRKIAFSNPKPSPTKLYRLSQAPSMPSVVMPYAKNREIFWSRAETKRRTPEERMKLGTSMTYNGVAAAWFGTMSEVKDPTQLAILLDHTAWKKPKGNNSPYTLPYGLADSSARFMPAEEGGKLFRHEIFLHALAKDYEEKMAKSAADDRR